MNFQESSNDHNGQNGSAGSGVLTSNGYLSNGVKEVIGNGRNGNGSNGNGAAGNEQSLQAIAVKQSESYDPEFEGLIEQMLVRVGEDPERDGLLRTPLRVAKAMDFLTSGYEMSMEEVVNNAVFEDDGQEMVVVKDIEFYSLCEHHMLPFYGTMHIAYIPNGKVIGLSKLARIADVFARRLQVQERLTNEIANALEEILEPKGVAVAAEAAHFCMMMRGVQKQNSTTLTSAMRGVFKTDRDLRNEFMQTVRK